jgi:NCS1 nucleoside transporter family
MKDPQQPHEDIEKHAGVGTPDESSQEPNTDSTPSTAQPVSKWKSYLESFERQLIAFNLETRGIKRVEPSERHDLKKLGYTQVFVLWFSINLAANNITLGMLGPAVFELGFLDSSLCAVFGMLVGCFAVGYTAQFGPRSGNRTMIFARFTMGWFPSKLVVILNIIVLLGYSLIDCVVAGQILSAVSPNNSLSIVVGIIIVAVMTWGITTFGYSVFHIYERWNWLPQVIVCCILAGVAGPKFDVTTPSIATGRTLVGNRLSFFSICLSAAITYAGVAGDYFVYYPEGTSRLKIASMTVGGLSASFTFAFLVGIGLASGIATNTNWDTAYKTSQGALIVEGYRPLGSFGSFCGVIIALGLIANLIPPTYSSGVDFQSLGKNFQRVPRVVWNTIGVIIYTVCALAGRDHLAEIFTNFLALMGYFVSIFIAICLEEHFIFRIRRSDGDEGFQWDIWNQQEKLPLGIAAIIAFLVGWAGSILCMAQVWYIGPIAKLVGDYGADVSSSFSFLSVIILILSRWGITLASLGRHLSFRR